MGHGRSWKEDNGKGQIKDIEDIGYFVFYRYSGIFLQILCQKFIVYEWILPSYLKVVMDWFQDESAWLNDWMMA